MITRLTLVLCCAGCMSDQSARNDVATLKRQLEDLRRQTDGDRHAQHELENRVFVLEDKVDTVHVAQIRTADIPRLPTITKKPTPTPEPVNVNEPEPEPGSSPAPAPAPEPDAESTAPPIVIRMHGNNVRPAPTAPTQSVVVRRPTEEPPDLAAVTEKLPVAGGAPRTDAAKTDDAMNAYRNAYAALTRHEHKAAIAGFRDFVERYPSNDYADNAQYWLGEAFYDQADYQTAIIEFRSVLKRFPAGNKTPDALLKIGFCLDKLGDASAAGDALGQVVQIYPRTDAARLAEKRLDEIRRVTR